MQINLTGFMEKNTSLFMKELWRLVISASKNPQGIPDEILEEQKAMHEKQVEAQKRVQEEIAKRMERHIGAKDTKATDPSPSAAAAAAVTTTATTASAPTSAPAKRRHRCVWRETYQYLCAGCQGRERKLCMSSLSRSCSAALQIRRWDRDTETDAKDSSKRSRQEEDSKSRSGQSRDSTRDRKDRSRKSERR